MVVWPGIYGRIKGAAEGAGGTELAISHTDDDQLSVSILF